MLPSCCRFWSQSKAPHRLQVVMVEPCGCVENHPSHSHGRAHCYSTRRLYHGMDDPDPSDIFRHDPKVGRPATPGPMTGPMLGPLLERRLALAWLTVESGIGRSPRATPRRNSTGDRPGSPAQSPAHLPIRPAAEKSAPRHPLLLTDQSFSSEALPSSIPTLGISDVGL